MALPFCPEKPQKMTKEKKLLLNKANPDLAVQCASLVASTNRAVASGN